MGLFGIGDGKMELQLKSQDVASGGTLEGTATLTLNKDVKGKGVVAILYAERTDYERTAKGGTMEKKVRIYSMTKDLDTEKLYTKQGCPYQYKFNFAIPAQTGSSVPKAVGEGLKVIGALAGTFGGLSGLGNSNIRWYVKAELNHESMLSFPIAKTQQVNIIASAPQPGAGL